MPPIRPAPLVGAAATGVVWVVGRWIDETQASKTPGSFALPFRRVQDYVGLVAAVGGAAIQLFTPGENVFSRNAEGAMHAGVPIVMGSLWELARQIKTPIVAAGAVRSAVVTRSVTAPLRSPMGAGVGQEHPRTRLPQRPLV